MHWYLDKMLSVLKTLATSFPNAWMLNFVAKLFSWNCLIIKPFHALVGSHFTQIHAFTTVSSWGYHNALSFL